MPTLVEKPAEGGGWIHEVKFDGYRTQIVIDDSGVRLFTRRGHDWTSKYSPIAEASKALHVERAVLDGEVIVTNDAGLSDFRALRSAITSRPQDLYFVAFDLLHLDGEDLRDLGVEVRRELLQCVIPPNGRIQFSEPLPGDANSIFQLIDQAGIEGMVSKRIGSTYRESGKPAFALLAEPGTGRYVGSAFITLNREMRERLWKRVQEHSGPAPKGMKRPATQWVKPGLIGRVKHLRGEEDLRHASLQDFREE
ncbi:ATP-dependent DNA ligase [Mesorhizobium waimense]|uniref:ATP-dependent DNA ligase n=2 Tax=Mesorhizobium waimense TaxID=1300307 RepID=A0A3A5KCB9_9HYPH|nr:ATP-dependent DNA ligase [Mesorhizobium waimense]